MKHIVVWTLACALAGTAATALAQGRPDGPSLIAAQKEAMAKLARMDGVWRGPAATTLRDGTVHKITQTERIGPFLDGAVKVIEGRGYEADGKVSFNAFGTLAYNPGTKAFSLYSHALGSAGVFPVTITEDGMIWTIPAGPNMTIRYTATIKDGTWNEVGDYVMADKPPVRFFEMNLKRVGSTEWPAAGAIPMN